MKNNSNSRIGTLAEIEKHLLENDHYVYFASEFITQREFKSVPCQVVATSKSIVKVNFNFNHSELFNATIGFQVVNPKKD